MRVKFSFFLPIPTTIFLLFSYTVISFGQTNIDQSNYDISFYCLDIHVNDTNTLITGKAQIQAKLIRKSDSVILNLGSNLKVEDVKVNSKKVEFVHRNDILSIPVNGEKARQNLNLSVWYSGDANHPGEYGAFFNRTTRNGSFTYSLSEPFASKYWYPCKEVLSDKTDSVFIFVTVPKGLKAGSLGLLDTIIEIDASHNQYRWKTFYPTAYYLLSVAVGPYKDYTYNLSIPGLQKKFPVVNYIYSSDYFFDNNKDQIDVTADLIKLFSEKYGVYPFHKEKYGHCLVPFSGGMEHQTMTTLGYFDFELVAHELAHQWFGNLVTCSDWNNIWINEGFASYSEYIALEELHSKEKAEAWLEYAYDLIKDYSEGSIYIPNAEINDSDRIFDFRLSYKKGAAIIHMLRCELNNDGLFFEILREYLSRNSFGNATANDFKIVLEEISGNDFTLFFEEWYYGQGYPLVSVNWYQEGDTLFVVNNQSTTAPDATKLFHLNLEYRVVTTQQDTIVNHKITSSSDTLKINMPFKVNDLQVDPNRNILMEVLNPMDADSK